MNDEELRKVCQKMLAALSEDERKELLDTIADDPTTPCYSLVESILLEVGEEK